MRKKRFLSGVECFRIFSIIAIVLLHTKPFANDRQLFWLFFVIDNVARFAIPFFFIVSGYFFYISSQKTNDIVSLCRLRCKRLIVIFVSWSFIYTMIPAEGLGENLLDLSWGRLFPLFVEHLTTKYNLILSEPVTTLCQGMRGSLWYLMSLAMAFVIITALIQVKARKWMMPISIILFTFGLLAKAYAMTPIGIDFSFNTRNGPFFSLLFVVIGYIYAQKKPQVPTISVLLLLFGGVVFRLIEVGILWQVYGASFKQDYSIGSIPLGLGVFLLSMKYKHLGSTWKWVSLSKTVLGIYVSQFIFVYLFRDVMSLLSPVVAAILFPAIVITCSLVLTLVLISHRKTAWLVN